MAIKRPILFAGAGVMLLSFLLKISFTFFLILAVALFTATVLLSFILNKQRLQFLFVAFAFVVFAVIGSFAHSNVEFLKMNLNQASNVTMVVTEVRESEYGFAAVGRLEKLNEKGLVNTKIRLYLSDEQQVCRGDKIEISANLSLMEDNNHYFSQNVFVLGKKVKILQKTPKADLVQHTMGKLQNMVRNAVNSNPSGRVAQFVLAVIVGDTAGIDDETYLNMQISGILHMVVVSGTHFTTVLAAVMFFVRRLFPKRKAKGIVSLFVILFIMLFCGFSMPVVRSGIAYFILTLAIFLDREGDSLCALAAATVIILFVCPYGAYSVSLLLTLSATFGILVLTPIINSLTKISKLRRHKVLYDVLNVLVVSVSANITTLPILMYTFDRVSLVSLLANLLINYSVSAVLVLALCAVVSPFTFLSKPLFLVSGLLSNYSLWAIDFCANLPLASLTVDGKKMSAVTVMLYAVVALIYFVFIKQKKRV